MSIPTIDYSTMSIDDMIALIGNINDQRVEREFAAYASVGGIEQARRYWADQGTLVGPWFRITHVARAGEYSDLPPTLVILDDQGFPAEDAATYYVIRTTDAEGEDGYWSIGSPDYEATVKAFLDITYPYIDDED